MEYPATPLEAQDEGQEKKLVAQFQDILDAGPNAPGLRGVELEVLSSAYRDPTERVVPFSWTCGVPDKKNKVCGKANRAGRTKYRRCNELATDSRNVKNDKNGNAIEAGDGMNLVLGRLQAKWWECGFCHEFIEILPGISRTNTYYCEACMAHDRLSELTNISWVWNEYVERLGSWNGKLIVELGPWMASLWAIHSRIPKNQPWADYVE